MQQPSLLHKGLTNRILKAYYNVYNELGYGFLEKVYQNALYLELKSRGFEVVAQKQITVFYKGQKVGEYFADMVVNEKVILELKASEFLLEKDECQLINYLRSTEYEVGLLLNFGTEPEFKRKIFQNIYKNFS